MRAFYLAIACLSCMHVFAEHDDLFGPATTEPTAELSSHPSGETPLERMIVLSHTEALPSSNKAIVYALSSPKANSPAVDPFDDNQEDGPRPEGQTFSGKGGSARILTSITLHDNEAADLGDAWRSLKFDKWSSAFCHVPVYGLRLYRDDQLLFETTICWKCTNFYLPDISGDRKGHQSSSQWYGFKKTQAALDLLELLKKHVPHPELNEN